MYLSVEDVTSKICVAIEKRFVLSVRYQHVGDFEIVKHDIAPFDIGSTNPNPKLRERNADKLYAYSFTHINPKLNTPDPKVCSFNIRRFLEIWDSGRTFDELELTLANLSATNYDYRDCRFALMPNRNWYGRQ